MADRKAKGIVILVESILSLSLTYHFNRKNEYEEGD